MTSLLMLTISSKNLTLIFGGEGGGGVVILIPQLIFS